MIGDYSYHYFKNTEIEDCENVVIGRYCQIAEGVIIAPGEHPSVLDKKFVANFPFGNIWNLQYIGCGRKGNTVIGNDVLICTNVIIMSGVKIGDGVIIGAGAVVSKDIPDFAVVVGNPATIKKYRFDKQQIKALKKIAWWNWDKDKITEILEDFKDITKFIIKYA